MAKIYEPNGCVIATILVTGTSITINPSDNEDSKILYDYMKNLQENLFLQKPLLLQVVDATNGLTICGYPSLLAIHDPDGSSILYMQLGGSDKIKLTYDATDGTLTGSITLN